MKKTISASYLGQIHLQQPQKAKVPTAPTCSLPRDLEVLAASPGSDPSPARVHTQQPHR